MLIVHDHDLLLKIKLEFLNFYSQFFMILCNVNILENLSKLFYTDINKFMM